VRSCHGVSRSIALLHPRTSFERAQPGNRRGSRLESLAAIGAGRRSRFLLPRSGSDQPGRALRPWTPPSMHCMASGVGLLAGERGCGDKAAFRGSLEAAFRRKRRGERCRCHCLGAGTRPQGPHADWHGAHRLGYATSQGRLVRQVIPPCEVASRRMTWQTANCGRIPPNAVAAHAAS
jgi:hypothetical protein